MDIPAQDRSHLISLTLGGSVFQPDQGGTLGLPVAALYLRRVEKGYRTRDVISIFVNELEYDKTLGHLEMVAHFENYNLPTGQTVVVHNREISATSVTWGSLLGALGPGLRVPVAPSEIDNDVRVQLLGRAGYFYAKKNDDTGATQVLPPDTLLYGAKLRVRYDGLRRNLLELPHHGLATGFDVDYLARDKWRNIGAAESGFSVNDNRDYVQASGYLVGAGGVPGMSERNRLLIALYGGTTADHRGDRFNAFHINGASFPSEADDLPHPHYGGLVYGDVLSTSYAIGSLGYRREVCFFLYASVIGSYIWADRATVDANRQVVFKDARAASATFSLDSAFFWNSEVYLAYSWDSGFMRGGKSGSGITVLWNKAF